MERWKFRQEMWGLANFLVTMFFTYAMINGIGIMRFDIEGMHTFLKYFNGIVMFGVLLIIVLLSVCRYNMIEYGTLTKPDDAILGEKE